MSNRSSLHKLISNLFKQYLPDFWYYIAYTRAAQIMGDKSEYVKQHFSQLVNESRGKRCLQIGVRDSKYALNWESVDLFDCSDNIDYHYDIHDLKFENESFDIIVCNAILEHVEHPAQAIREMYRVLNKNGKIWIEIPFNQPYHPSPCDYWRVTLSGMRIWMHDFSEIEAGFFKINRSPIYNAIFFYGQKSNHENCII